jgi:hypothetical protein
MKPSASRPASVRQSTAVAGAAALLVVATTLGSATQPTFRPDDPIREERDTEDARGVKPTEMNLFVDFAYNTITARRPTAPKQAGNVNTVDEVPDSSWYTNRAGSVAVSPDQVARGPNTLDGPRPGTWTVTSSKSDGITPGLTMTDTNGQRWFVKFDPRGLRGMSTGTEVVVTKLMWALGYHVPENYIAYLRRDQLAVGEGAKFTPPSGKRRAMRLTDIDRMLARVDREADGSYRIVASRALEGTPIGRLRFEGTRPDDPNDIVPHEDRRELRGYGTFAAWLNHVDAKAINSLDTLVTKDGRAFVRHHLIDFGSALGSGGVAPADYWAGAEYIIEKPGLKQMVGLGFVRPDYQRVQYFEAPAVGRLPKHNAAFDPEAWKPRIPNTAFLHARLDDKFWAARKLTALSTDLLRAAVKTGDFGDPAAEAFLVRVLAERRDAILRAYLPAINPVVDPVLAEGRLSFRNAAVDADLARTPSEYWVRWSRFDNATGEVTPIATTTSEVSEVRAPINLPEAPGAYVQVDISATASAHPAWARPVRATFTRVEGGWKLVGFERII